MAGRNTEESFALLPHDERESFGFEDETDSLRGGGLLPMGVVIDIDARP